MHPICPSKEHLASMKKYYFLLCLCLFACSVCITAQGQVRGNASYYADKFHGRRTASGEVYNKDSMTCAHLNYPFGTILKVRNPQNGRTVYVRVTDRGPYIKHRIIDLSKAAARELDIIRTGFALVEITPLNSFDIPLRMEENGESETPELNLMFAPPITFPEPIWECDTVKVAEKLKSVTSSWTFPKP